MYEFGYSRNVFINFYNFAHIVELDQLRSIDHCAASDIKHLQSLIDDLKQYRSDLASYAQQQTLKPYVLKLLLKRDPDCYSKQVTYQIRLMQIYDNGIKNVIEEDYRGVQRHEALKRYGELLKAHPGIEAEKDIAKRPWEK